MNSWLTIMISTFSASCVWSCWPLLKNLMGIEIVIYCWEIISANGSFNTSFSIRFCADLDWIFKHSFQFSFGFLGPKLICYFSLTLRIVKRTFLSKILCVKMPKTVQKIVIFLVLKINLRFYATMFGIEMKWLKKLSFPA
jgi:hypothetical protein